jgi:hypothetical protein
MAGQRLSGLSDDKFPENWGARITPPAVCCCNHRFFMQDDEFWEVVSNAGCRIHGVGGEWPVGKSSREMKVFPHSTKKARTE